MRSSQIRTVLEAPTLGSNRFCGAVVVRPLPAPESLAPDVANRFNILHGTRQSVLLVGTEFAGGGLALSSHAFWLVDEFFNRREEFAEGCQISSVGARDRGMEPHLKLRFGR